MNANEMRKIGLVMNVWVPPNTRIQNTKVRALEITPEIEDLDNVKFIT